MNDLSKEELEIKIAFLERHAEEQDRVILNMENRIDRLQESIEALQARIKDLQEPAGGSSDPERPPHY